MASESNWSDKKKWLMGIISALIVAAVIALSGYLRDGGKTPGSEPSPAPIDPSSTPLLTETDIPPETPPPASTPAPKATITPKNFTRESNGFRFSFSGSTFKDRKLRLNITVKSIGQDRKLWIHHNTRLIDDAGNVYNPSRTTLGTMDQTFGGMSYDCPADTPVLMTIEFDNINSNVRRFELLEVDHFDFKVRYSGDELFVQPSPIPG